MMLDVKFKHGKRNGKNQGGSIEFELFRLKMACEKGYSRSSKKILLNNNKVFYLAVN